MAMTDDQARIASRVQSILNQKNSDGSFAYTNDEVRDFVAACVLELGLPLDASIEPTVLKFLAAVGLPENADEATFLTAIQAYFEKNPLNPTLMAELNAFGRSELVQDSSKFGSNAAQVKAMHAAGAGARAMPEKAGGVAAPSISTGLSN